MIYNVWWGSTLLCDVLLSVSLSPNCSGGILCFSRTTEQKTPANFVVKKSRGLTGNAV
jgi:hypothetical protein